MELNDKDGKAKRGGKMKRVMKMEDQELDVKKRREMVKRSIEIERD